MKKIIKSNTRGLTRNDWLTSFHSFSFGDYFDYEKVNFGPLRVINEDTIKPQNGFGTHPHRDMEIITIVLEGELTHTDSTGNSEIIKYGEIQKMSAGKGIFHSEINDSATEKVHLLQIWIMPEKMGIEPSYEKIEFTPDKIKNKLFYAAGNNPESPIFIHQDIEFSLSDFDKGKSVPYTISTGRQIYIQIINGKTKIGEVILTAGDALELDEAGNINLEFEEPTRFILFNLPVQN